MIRPLFFILYPILCGLTPVAAQSIITRDPMVNAMVTETGELVITPAKNSSARDFDFLTGKWTMHNKRLKTRLNGCTEWEEFDSSDENVGSILDGVGNLDYYHATFRGKPLEGITIRLFDPQKKLWSLYWASNTGVMDPPVVGSFDGSIGFFYGKDVYQGQSIIFLFKWDKTDPDNPVWSQAFSTDNGASWEWNFTNTSHRIK